MTLRTSSTWGAASAVALFAVAVFFAAGSARSDPWATVVAIEEPFRQVLLEKGTVGAARMMVYGSALTTGGAKIVELVAEGASVTPGDLLLRLDATTLQQSRLRERASLDQAEADLRRAREDLRLEALQSSADLDGARQQIARAETDLASEERGKGQVEVLEARAAAAEADAEAARAATALADLRPMLREGFITKAELERAEQAVRRTGELKALADARLAAMLQYERPAAINRSRAALATARDGLQRESQASSAKLSQRRAAVALAEARVAELTARIRALDEQIARTEVRAGASGLVVYKDLFFGSDRRKPQVGDEVWPNQPVLALPDAATLLVETRVREADLARVTGSARVWIGVDAYPDIRLAGRVALVGALAQEDPAAPGTRFFPLTIQFDTRDDRLRPGMTARLEIEVARLDRAVTVPVETVFSDGGSRYCVVLENGRPVRRPVTVAGENETRSAVSSGLAAGERVLTSDPTESSRRR